MGWKILYTPIAPNVAARVNYARKEMYIDKDLLWIKFLEEAWMHPRREGVKPLPRGIFTSYGQWESFVVEHERQHILNPRTGAWTPEYENSINDKALLALGLA